MNLQRTLIHTHVKSVNSVSARGGSLRDSDTRWVLPDLDAGLNSVDLDALWHHSVVDHANGDVERAIVHQGLLVEDSEAARAISTLCVGRDSHSLSILTNFENGDSLSVVRVNGDVGEDLDSLSSFGTEASWSELLGNVFTIECDLCVIVHVEVVVDELALSGIEHCNSVLVHFNFFTVLSDLIGELIQWRLLRIFGVLVPVAIAAMATRVLRLGWCLMM